MSGCILLDTNLMPDPTAQQKLLENLMCADAFQLWLCFCVQKRYTGKKKVAGVAPENASKDLIG